MSNYFISHSLSHLLSEQGGARVYRPAVTADGGMVNIGTINSLSSGNWDSKLKFPPVDNYELQYDPMQGMFTADLYWEPEPLILSDANKVINSVYISTSC